MDETLISSFFSGKRVVVTGGGGSVGAELVRQLLMLPVDIVRALDNNETALFDLRERHYAESRLEAFYCDIRDELELARTFSGMDICLHAAALKHVPFCELSPFSAIQTNILGAQAVIRAALSNRLSRVLFTSTDKAVNPTNVMGTSKLMGERLFTAANSLSEGSHRCIFSSTRFGNVAGSRGSVIPLFCEQIAQGRPLTVTDTAMTRFFMTREDAVRLVLRSMALACGGEIFITKMAVIRVIDLAEVMIDLIAPLFGRSPSDVPIHIIGPRPGEKMWEELTTEEEVRRTHDMGEFLVVLPALKNFHADVDYAYDVPLATCEHNYNSTNEIPMSKDEIRAFLSLPGVLPTEVGKRQEGCGL